MSNGNTNVKQFDAWIKDNSAIAALVMRQRLESVEGADAVIFPPTFLKPEGVRDNEWTGYNIDRFDGGTSMCLIDSVGSQANRMEPVFKQEGYKHLVPQISIKTEDSNIHILDAGHRAADAVVRFASKMEGAVGSKPLMLGEELWKAFRAWQNQGDAEPLARIAPTTCVFGAWDSRATQAKLPRIIRSVIRAYDVRQLTRSAIYNPPIHYVNEGVIDEKHDKGQGDRNPLSQEGFHDNPASGTHGGIEVKGEIRRDAIINLAALRSLGVEQRENETAEDSYERTRKLRRYILGLALVSLTHHSDQMFNLREGCLLRAATPITWKGVPFEGEKHPVSIDSAIAYSYASETAASFGVQQFNSPFVFDKKIANEWLSKKKDERDKLRRNGSVVAQG